MCLALIIWTAHNHRKYKTGSMHSTTYMHPIPSCSIASLVSMVKAIYLVSSHTCCTSVDSLFHRKCIRNFYSCLEQGNSLRYYFGNQFFTMGEKMPESLAACFLSMCLIVSLSLVVVTGNLSSLLCGKIVLLVTVNRKSKLPLHVRHCYSVSYLIKH